MKHQKPGDARFVTGASMALAMSATLMAGPSQAGHVEAFYSTGDYTYCDAKLLGTYWRQTPFDSKLRAGEKIGRGEDYVVKDYLKSARAYAMEHNVRCTFEDANNPQYTYGDASLLARYWGEKTPYDGKLKIARLLQQGHNKNIRAALEAAKRGGY